MTPEDIRNASWADLEKLVTGQREMVYNSLEAFGPITTSLLALKMQRSVLSVRPRITELFDLGLVELVGKDGHEGIYRAISVYAARQQHEQHRRAQQQHQARQLQLL